MSTLYDVIDLNEITIELELLRTLARQPGAACDFMNARDALILARGILRSKIASAAAPWFEAQP